MHSSSYYYRKADACRELGHWAAADRWAAMATKARTIETRKRAKYGIVTITPKDLPQMPESGVVSPILDR